MCNTGLFCGFTYPCTWNYVFKAYLEYLANVLFNSGSPLSILAVICSLSNDSSFIFLLCIGPYHMPDILSTDPAVSISVSVYLCVLQWKRSVCQMRMRGAEMLWLRRCSSKETRPSSSRRLQKTNRDRARQKPADMMKMVHARFTHTS